MLDPHGTFQCLKDMKQVRDRTFAVKPLTSRPIGTLDCLMFAT